MDKNQINKSRLPNKHLAKVINSSLKHEMEKMASQLHGNWEYCDSYARGMHIRNIHQILGYDLKTPVNAVITWCDVDSLGNPIGGTRTALKLAEQYKIPIFNLNSVNPNEVLIQIHSAAINQLDAKLKSGEFKMLLPYKFPLILSWSLRFCRKKNLFKFNGHCFGRILRNFLFYQLLFKKL